MLFVVVWLIIIYSQHLVTLTTTMSLEPRETDGSSSVATVNLNLPPFWPSDPLVWFAQVEAQFSPRHITAQKTKFDHVVASLTPEYATEVRDLILKPPDTTPYDTLKAHLVKRTEASEQRRLQQLFNAEELGDRKPSQLLRHMHLLLGEKATTTDSSFLRELFLQCLLTNVRLILASTADTLSLEDLAALADKIMEVHSCTPSVASVTSSQLATEVDKLRAEIVSLKKMVNRRPTSRRTRTRSSSPARPLISDSSVCWYHQTFGADARKCKPLCSWTGNGQASH